MATTQFFEACLKDKEAGSELDLEFGRSSFYGENLIYIRAGTSHVIVNEGDGRAFYDAVLKLGHYLGYDQPKRIP